MACVGFCAATLERPGRVTAEVSLGLMIMNYAEGHILLVTSHLHGFPLDCLGCFNFFPLLLGNNSLNRCSKLSVLTFYFSSTMQACKTTQGAKKKKTLQNQTTTFPEMTVGLRLRVVWVPFLSGNVCTNIAPPKVSQSWSLSCFFCPS